MPKLKFNHHELLTDDLTMVINGKRNAGKTTLLFNLLTAPGIIDYNNLMIYSKLLINIYINLLNTVSKII